MPLNRDSTTIGAWTAARAYPPFTMGVGLSLMLTDPLRLRETPGFDYAARFVDLAWWGLGFFLVGAALGIALILQSRALYMWALPVAMLWFTIWSVLLIISAFDGNSSYAAWTWPAVIVWGMWAVQLGLASGQGRHA